MFLPPKRIDLKVSFFQKYWEIRTFVQIYHCLPFIIYYCIDIIWMLASFFTNLPVNKAYTTCYLIYRVDLGYIWSLNSDLRKHSVLDIY